MAPRITIPRGAAPPTNPAPTIFNEDLITITPAEEDSLGLYARPSPRNSAANGIPFPAADPYARPPSRPASVYEGASSPQHAYNDSQPYRSPTRSTLRPHASLQNLTHRPTKSETSVPRPSVGRGESRPPSYISPESSPELPIKDLSDELSNVTLQSEEGLRRFQAGELTKNEEEWPRLVPPEAISVLDKKEVSRQCALFEIILSEKEYVHDMELIQDVFIDPLLNTAPIPQQRLKGFVSEVFWNMNEILAIHRTFLQELFKRQQEQHPLVMSIADIVLDATLTFRDQYEEYIKHYPLAEARHRKELNRNAKYKYFLSQCAQDPRIRKRDLISLLTRPVTRLPRLLIQLDAVHKHTLPDHPDQETLPLIHGLLNDYIKSSQPGIEAAESKVKFWELCESLSYQKGEIIDLDLYDESRTLLFSGPLARRYRGEVGYSWADLHVALLDNYLLLLKPTRSNGTIRHVLISRPLPLEYLRLASFDAVPESRKEKAHSSTSEQASAPSSRLFDYSFRSRYRQMWPFTIYHASAKSARRYTLYADSEEGRGKWRGALRDAVGVRMARMDSNKWFAPHTVNEGYFRSSGSSSSGRATGKITCAIPMTSGGRNFVAVGCSTGVYVSYRGTSDFRRVLKKTNVQSLHVLQDFNKVLLHSDEGLESYALDLVAGVAMLSTRPQDLDASREQISGADTAVLFVRVGKIGGRTMVLYTTKSFIQVSLYALEVVSVAPGVATFRAFGQPVWIPKDSHDITSLAKNIGICTERGIHIVDPTNLGASNKQATIIPDFSDPSDPMQALKMRCAGAKPTGLVRVPEANSNGNGSSGSTIWNGSTGSLPTQTGGGGAHRSTELLVIFDELGCYITRHGIPCRSSGYLRWESKASSFTHRGNHLLLFSSEFIEIRDIRTGRLAQVIEGSDIRLLNKGEGEGEKTILVAMKGKETGVEKLLELVETQELEVQLGRGRSESTSVGTGGAGLWDEWDMRGLGLDGHRPRTSSGGMKRHGHGYGYGSARQGLASVKERPASVDLSPLARTGTGTARRIY